MEPISLILLGAAASGVTGKLAEKFTEYVGDLVRGQEKATQEAAAHNAAAFLNKLSHQLEKLDASSSSDVLARTVDKALADPDVATTVRTAVLSAARTANEEKHSILARAVAERLSSEAESIEAVASNLAVEALPRLAATHLAVLGMTALVYVIRPGIQEILGSHSLHGAVRSSTEMPGSNYITWLKTNLQIHALNATLGELYLSHLASASCIVLERKVKRDLARTLEPTPKILFDPRALLPIQFEITDFLDSDPIGRDLGVIWHTGLQHLTLTPAGLLIGTAVHEVKSGQPTPVAWNRSEDSQSLEIDEPVWNGRHLSENFLEALDREIRDRASRRVGPWSNLDTKRD